MAGETMHLRPLFVLLTPETIDCAFAAGATYIVSDDSHLNILRDITFPQLLVLRLKEFLETLHKEE